MTNEIMIVTGEASGDLHGAQLVKSMRASNPNLSFCGMGGVELEREGVEILFEAAKIAVVGLFEVLSHLGDIITAQKTLRKRLVDTRPKLLILIDFPDFNLLLARKAKRLGIPIFYYISPQVWAWRSGRVATIARLIDRIGVILPFEEQFYRERGVDAHYVGHPLLDSVHTGQNRKQFCLSEDIDPKRKLVGILPGSRIKEIRRLLPVFLDSALVMQNKSREKPVFLVPRAPTITEKDLLLNGIAHHRPELDIRIISENRYNLMAACDAVVAASGTVTLELLLLNTVMVVAYKISPRTYHIGKLLIKIKYFSLVNLIADDEIITELLQDGATPEQIGLELHRLTYDHGVRLKMKADFEMVRKKLGTPGASGRAAELALGLIT